jgi:hypothetical protein
VFWLPFQAYTLLLRPLRSGGAGAGGGGAGGAGENGTNLFSSNTALGGALGNSTSPNGNNARTIDASNNSNPKGGAGGGGGWNGGQGGVWGASGGGGSNYANTSITGLSITSNGSHGARANGFTSLTYRACAAPSPISSITVTQSDKSATLSFPTPADNGTPITGYQYSFDNGSTWSTLSTSGSTTKTATVGALSPMTSYSIQVRGVYSTADIVANDVAYYGPGRGVTAYGSALSQSFTTLATTAVASVEKKSQPSLADTGFSNLYGFIGFALAALIAGAALILVVSRKGSA